MLLLCTLRGSIIIYQGEELGLPQVDIPFDRLQDPEAIANWPQTLSRDGARTPMPWNADAPNLGFSSGESWLPAGASHRGLAVDRQDRDPLSLLAFSRKCLALRKAHGVLRNGSVEVVKAGEQILLFDRVDGDKRLRCTFNLSDTPASFDHSGRTILSSGEIAAGVLGPYAAVIEEIA
jgi:alpha-glucosidase